MSEIVRPTRDGIHGREYISTSVDIGPKPMRLEFDASGAVRDQAELIEVQMPILLDAAPWGDPSEAIVEARVSAAAALKTLAVVPARHLRAVPEEERRFVVPLFEGEDVFLREAALDQVRLVEIADGPSLPLVAAEMLGNSPGLLVAARVPLRPDAAERVLALREAGIRIVHLCADFHGREIGEGEAPAEPSSARPSGSAGASPSQDPHSVAERPRFVKDVLREVHGALVQAGIRDEVTLIGSGGIGLAEHTAKAVICGADLVGVDIPLLVALGCRVCSGDHAEGCPAQIQRVDVPYATQRMVNLMGAWHSQLIEVLGAMGIREVRRLRGEVGRAMFIEDLERDAFREIVRQV